MATDSNKVKTGKRYLAEERNLFFILYAICMNTIVRYGLQS